MACPTLRPESAAQVDAGCQYLAKARKAHKLSRLLAVAAKIASEAGHRRVHGREMFLALAKPHITLCVTPVIW